MFSCYSDSILNRAINIANKTPREKLLQENPDRKNINRRNRGPKGNSFSFSSTPIFSTLFSMEFYKIKNIKLSLNNFQYYLMIRFTQRFLLMGLRLSCRAPTLGGTLSPSLYTSLRPSRHWLQFKGTFGCGHNGCPCCPHIGSSNCHQQTVKHHHICQL